MGSWTHRWLDGLRRHFPNAACRARNTLELGPWYAARLRRRWAPSSESYSPWFWDLHDTGDWIGFARVVLKLFPSSSVVDIGCGQGSALEGFAAADPRLTLRGFDDSATAIARARERQLRIDSLDVVSLSRAQAQTLARDIGSVDLVLCLEVAEHLPAWHAGKLLDILTCGRQLIFSAAHPNQSGTLHVNERPAGYWIERLADRGFHVSPRDAELRAAVATLTLAPWYKNNIHGFERRERNR
jgi:SAM-dependent methyltransferase